jgi:predicted ArsR family transcriptional regulator
LKKRTFITNHALTLTFLSRHPSITARELAEKVGVTERAIRKTIADLAAEGYLEKTKEGRRVRYRINSQIPMRHPTQKDKMVGELLKVLRKEKHNSNETKT